MAAKKGKPWWAIGLMFLLVPFSIIQPEFLPITIPVVLVLLAI